MKLNRNNPRIGMDSPWSRIDSVSPVGPGVVFVSTPSHGGYIVSDSVLESMPAAIRESGTFCGVAGCFEEDCEWVKVYAAFPDLFPDRAGPAASALAARFYPFLIDAGLIPAPASASPASA